MVTTNVFSRNLERYLAGEKLIINQGGTRSSKSFSIVQLLILIAKHAKKQLLISIVSESMPHLKRGCIRDFENIMRQERLWDDSKWNQSSSIYYFSDNVVIEFFSADQSSKLRGGSRQILFINEVNNITKASFDELDVRTEIVTFVDYNPVSPFWIEAKKTASNFIHSTYLDAKQVLSRNIVDKIEMRRNDKNFWRVYGLGLTGSIEGLVYPDFTIIDEFPSSDKSIYGLDFGFSSDPSALTKVLIQEHDLFLEEKIYETGLTNQAISNRFAQLGLRKAYDEIYGDSAEPKSIEEIKLTGYLIKPTLKGPDSVIAGIRKCQEYRIHVTKNSVHGIKELRNLMFVEIGENEDGEKLYGTKITGEDHFCDSFRYPVFTKMHKKGIDYAAFTKM